MGADHAKALKRAVTFAADVYVSNIEFEDGAPADGGAGRTPICSTLCELDAAFEASVHGLHSARFFFKQGLRRLIEAELSERRGACGLPGTIMPEVPTAVLQHLRKPLPALLRAYINQVADVLRGAAEAAISRELQAFPAMKARLLEAAGKLCDKRAAEAHATAKHLLTWECVVHTSNHYYMDTVNSVRQAIGAAATGAATTSSCPVDEHTVKRLKTAYSSNEAQKVVDMQIELFAYWKMMKKRLIDYAQLSARSILILQPLETLLRSHLQAEIESAAASPGLVATMCADTQRQLKFERASARQAKLKDAVRAIADARKSLGMAGDYKV